MPTNPLNQPPPLDQPPRQPGWVPFDTAPPPALHQRTYHHTQRHHGTAPHARHQGAAHHPHAHTLAGHHALHHPHQAASAAHRSPGVTQSVKHLARSHARLTARLGLQKIELGVITAVDLLHNQVYLRLYGSQTNVIGPVPLGVGLAGVAGAGMAAMVVLLDEANPSDALVVALYGGAAPASIQRGTVNLTMASSQQTSAVAFTTAFPTALDAAVASTEDGRYIVGVSGKTTTGFDLVVTRRDGGQQLQAGTLNVSVGGGAGSAGQSLTFPSAFGVLRTLQLTARAINWLPSSSGLSASGATVNVSGVNGALGAATVPVDWCALGDPAIDDAITVDWIAVGH